MNEWMNSYYSSHPRSTVLYCSLFWHCMLYHRLISYVGPYDFVWQPVINDYDDDDDDNDGIMWIKININGHHGSCHAIQMHNRRRLVRERSRTPYVRLSQWMDTPSSVPTFLSVTRMENTHRARSTAVLATRGVWLVKGSRSQAPEVRPDNRVQRAPRSPVSSTRVLWGRFLWLPSYWLTYLLDYLK